MGRAGEVQFRLLPVNGHFHIVVVVDFYLAVLSVLQYEVDKADATLGVGLGLYGEIEELVEVLIEVNVTPDGGLPYHIALAQERIGHGTLAYDNTFLVEVVRVLAVFGINDALCIACKG